MEFFELLDLFLNIHAKYSIPDVLVSSYKGNPEKEALHKGTFFVILRSKH
tara:strand:+ start:337 stop:486 length:150 start_codon:yes stop_codon:yes gene_type:complete